MNRFLTLFLLAFSRIFSKKNIVVLVILFGILMYGIHKGAVEWRNKIIEISEFKKTEKNWFSQLKDYKEYSIRGIKIFFMSNNLGVLFANPVMLNELAGKVNSVIALNIYNNCRDSNVMKGNSMLKFRFSVIVLVLGSLAVLFLGADPFRYRDYLKFLSSTWSKKMIFICIILTRIILIALTFLVILGCSLLLLLVENVNLAGSDFQNILRYLVVTYLVLIFFFIIGTILGTLLSKRGLIAGILVVWFALVFLWPGVVDSIIEDKANEITSTYKTDTQKLQIVNEFENKYIKERGGYKNYTHEESRDIVDGYLKNEFPQIEAMDEGQEAAISSVINDYMDLSVLIPTSFYNATCYELSGRGYGNYLNFSRYLRKQRREFLLFWIGRVYYNDPEVMINFVTGEENIYRSQGMKPANYGTGCLIIVGLIILLGFISYIVFKRSLVCMKTRDIIKLGKVNLKIEPGNLSVKLVKGKVLIHALYSLFSGNINHLTRKGFKGEVFMGDIDITKKKNKKKFIFICLLDSFPGDIKVKTLLKFYGGWMRQSPGEIKTVLTNNKIEAILDQPISKLEIEEKFEVAMSLLGMSRSAVYLIDNITSEMHLDDVVRFKDHVDELVQQGATVLFLTTPRLIGEKTIKLESYFENGDAWVYLVKSHKQFLMLQG